MVGPRLEEKCWEGLVGEDGVWVRNQEEEGQKEGKVRKEGARGQEEERHRLSGTSALASKASRDEGNPGVAQTKYMAQLKGEGWGQEGFWSWVAGVTDNSIYPVLFASYLEIAMPNLVTGWRRTLLCIAISIALVRPP